MRLRSVGRQDRVVARVRRGRHVRPRLAVFRPRYHSCHCRGRRCGRCRGNHQIVPLFRARTTLGSAVAALIDNGASQPQKIRPGQAERETFSAPEVLEPVRRQLGVTHRVLNVSVPEPSLQRPGVVAGIGQRVAAAVPQHPICLPQGGRQVLGTDLKCSESRRRRSALKCLRP
jgi:hypothetical protein